MGISYQTSIIKKPGQIYSPTAKQIVFDNNGRPPGINGFNFIRDLQWYNMEKEIEAIQVGIFRFWDEKEMKEKLSLYGNQFVLILQSTDVKT